MGRPLDAMSGAGGSLPLIARHSSLVTYHSSLITF